jgi:hypothetical protein
MRDDELLRKYLLGELTGEDESVLEARLIQDNDLFERAEAMEADLLEEYAHGGLSAAQSTHLQRHLIASSATRSQLAMVRGLGKEATEETSWRRILTGPWGRTELSRPSVRALAAAMLVIAVGAGWLDYRSFQLQTQIERIAQQGFALPDRPHVPPPPGTDRPIVAPPIHPTAPTPGDRIAGPTQTPAPPPAPVMQTFTLALTTFRGPEDTKTLEIAAETEQVDIHLPLSQADGTYSSFQVALQDEAGTELIRTDLRPVRAGEGTELVLSVKTKLLRKGGYELHVLGKSADGQLEDVAFPQFQVAFETNPPR